MESTDFFATGYNAYGELGYDDAEQAWDALSDPRLPDLNNDELELAHQSFVEGFEEAAQNG